MWSVNVVAECEVMNSVLCKKLTRTIYSHALNSRAHGLQM